LVPNAIRLPFESVNAAAQDRRPCSVRAFTRHQGVDKGTQIAQLDGVTVGQNRRLRLNIAFQ